MMNEKAESILMEDTVFTDPSGFDPGNVSTAQDIFYLIRYVKNNRSRPGVEVNGHIGRLVVRRDRFLQSGRRLRQVIDRVKPAPKAEIGVTQRHHADRWHGPYNRFYAPLVGHAIAPVGTFRDDGPGKDRGECGKS